MDPCLDVMTNPIALLQSLSNFCWAWVFLQTVLFLLSKNRDPSGNDYHTSINRAFIGPLYSPSSPNFILIKIMVHFRADAHWHGAYMAFSTEPYSLYRFYQTLCVWRYTPLEVMLPYIPIHRESDWTFLPPYIIEGKWCTRPNIMFVSLLCLIL